MLCNLHKLCTSLTEFSYAKHKFRYIQCSTLVKRFHGRKTIAFRNDDDGDDDQRNIYHKAKSSLENGGAQ